MRLLPLVALAACGGEPRVDSCADPLGGVWRASAAPAPGGGPRRYHLLDHGAAVEAYPMFDSTAPATGDKLTAVFAASPEVYDLIRDGEVLRGALSFRITRGAVTCLVRWPAEVRTCADGALVLATQRGDPAATDWTTCAMPAGTWDEVVLRRD